MIKKGKARVFGKRIHYAWWVLVAVVVFFGISRGGVQKALSQIYPAAALTFGVDPAVTSLAYTVSGIINIFWAPVVGRLLAEHDLRKVLSIGAVVYCGSFAAFYFAANVPLFFIIFTVVSMGSIIMTIQAGPVIINRWFKAKKGLATGIMMAAVGLLGGLIQGFLGNLIANHGWQTGSAMVGLGSLAICLPVIFFIIRNSPEDKGLQIYGGRSGAQEESAENKVKAALDGQEGLTAQEARRKPAFYLLLLTGMLITEVAAYRSLIPTMGRFMGYAGLDPAIVGGNGSMFFMFGTVIGALAFGSLTDRIGARNPGIIAMCIGIISTLILIFGASIDPAVFYGGLFLYGIMASCVGTMVPLITIGVFGAKDFSRIYGFVQAAAAIGGMITIPIFTFILTQTGDINIILYTILGMCFLIIFGLIGCFALSKRHFAKD
ncbi:MAG: MFS transporter [Coriobacteriaceae bacterium]|nr:MFS transporter [Coriobacteriaceae bacterium]